MKKNNYIAPQVRCYQLGTMLPLCTSPSTDGRKIRGGKRGDEFWDDDFDLTYGGIDDESDGLLDPS